MDSFLGKIAQRIATDHPRDTDRVLVVLNNNRSVRFFKKQFERIGKPMFLPHVTTIDDFVAQLGGLEIVPSEFLLFELYSIHIDIGGAERKYQTFEDFIAFGDLMIGDFSEVDQYCVDARLLFDNLHSLKSIGEWDIESPTLNDFQRDYLAFYRSLYDYYERLHARLMAQGKAYSGMAYRHVAEHIAEHADRNEWAAIYFVGFNALSECERRIIGEYVRRGVGHLFADHDPYFTLPGQESGYFLAKHAEEFPELMPTGASLYGQGEKHITIVECPESILQCKYAGQWLASHPTLLAPANAEKTAIVLADESLLMPTLNSLPDSAHPYSVNISMGYAYTDSVVHALMLRLLSLYRQQDPRGYYHTDIVNLLGNRHIGALAGDDMLRSKAEALIADKGLIRCPASLLTEHLVPSALGYLFPNQSPHPREALVLMRHLIGDIVVNELLESNKKEKQAAASLVEVLDNLDALMAAHDYITTLDTLEKIYSRIAQRHTIALLGEPLAGLQILGMLETRNLDFEHLILLSANEGILPAGHTAGSLIPHELKVHFGMPTYVEKDSVYAHHFYRLLLRAKEIHLVYSSESESMGKGEPSRFLRQVEAELAPRFGIAVTHLTATTDSHLHQSALPTGKKKSEAVMQRLAEMAQNGLSPTSFTDYIECPLKYYYSRVLRIDSDNGIDDDLDASQLGDCVHGVLQSIYTPHLGHPLRIDVMQQALDNLHEHIDQQFEQLLRGGRSHEGHNHFLYTVAENQLRHLLQKEIKILKEGHTITVLAVEDNLPLHPIIGAPLPVNIKGKADRIDRFDGTLRIIDYKTGRVDDKEITYRDGQATIPSKWLQLMWYALLYHRSHPTPALLSAIYPLRHLRSDIKMARWESDAHDDPQIITPAMLDRFEEMLVGYATTLMNPAADFVPTPSSAACTFCPARDFCPNKR